MTLEEFDTTLLRHGPDLGTWPVDRGTAARALLAQNADARILLDEAHAMSDQLQRAMKPGVPDSVIVARLQTALHDRQNRQPAWAILPVGRLATLASIAGLGGVIAGLAAPAGSQVLILLAMAMGGVTP